MGLKKALSDFFDRYFFNVRWRCAVCEKEIFDGGYFCKDCEEKLTVNAGYICDHCGRSLLAPAGYCSSCKEFSLSVDMSRSAFIYDKSVSTLIMKLKYGGKKFIAGIFAEYLYYVYIKFAMCADCAVYVPMTKRAERKRGFNQSKLLAEKFSALTGVPVCDCIKKDKETERQATLGRNKRLINLSGAFTVTDRKAVAGKSVLIVDDVMTTGATSETIAAKLKKAGAVKVMLLTVASVPPEDGY